MRLAIDLEHPSRRPIQRAAEALAAGKLVVYPTDTAYALGADPRQKKAVEAIYRLKRKDTKAPLSIICADLSGIARFAQVTHYAYRVLKRYLPGPYTFVLDATKEVPRMMLDPKRKTIGIRVPACEAALMLARELDGPIVAATARVSGSDPIDDPITIEDLFGHEVEYLLDAGLQPFRSSTVVSLQHDRPEVLREGIGEFEV